LKSYSADANLETDVNAYAEPKIKTYSLMEQAFILPMLLF